eukprot:5749633-Prymnesium_polylepis.3
MPHGLAPSPAATAFVSLLAFEADLRERPIKVLLPSDSRYCWRNVAGKYSNHPYLYVYPLDVGSARATLLSPSSRSQTPSRAARPACHGSRRRSSTCWQGATPHIFVDAALSGCVVSRDVLDLRADAPPDGVHAILSSAMGLVQSGFKDYGLSSMLFIDDAPLEACADRATEACLASAVAGGAHALIKHAPVTSIP